MIHYLPLEYEPMRYTETLDYQIKQFFKTNGIIYSEVAPDISEAFCRPLPTGLFLDAPRTIAYKTAQLHELAYRYVTDEIQDGDIVFMSDLWCPGIESLAYLGFFEKKKVRLRGLLHAGAFTDTDFCRQMERWAALFEDVLFDISDKVIVASDFVRKDILQKRLVSDDKILVSPWPSYAPLKRIDGLRENIVVFNGRLCDEKQPELFDLMRECTQVPENTRWISTHQHRFTKDEYHDLLSRAKCVVSFALQENYGVGVIEAVLAGCYPVVPKRLAYPEFYPEKCLYRHFQEAQLLVSDVLNNYNDAEQIAVRDHVQGCCVPRMHEWFE